MSRIANNETLSDWLERAWLQRYLGRKLSAPETEWFEAYMLDKPHLIAEIEADSDLRDGLALLAASPADDGFAPRSKAHAGPRWRFMALAASVVAAWGLGLLLAGPLSIGDRGHSAQVIASPQRLVFDTLRGVDSPPLVHPGAPGSSHVLVEVGLPADAEHVTLHLAGQPALALLVSPDGFASFLLPRAKLSDEPEPRIEYRRAGVTVSRTLDLSAVH